MHRRNEAEAGIPHLGTYGSGYSELIVDGLDPEQVEVVRGWGQTAFFFPFNRARTSAREIVFLALRAIRKQFQLLISSRAPGSRLARACAPAR